MSSIGSTHAGRAACKGLFDLYAQDASLEYACDHRKIFHGRADLASHRRPRLDAFSPTAFGMDEITPDAEGVVISFGGKPVRIFFVFDAVGRIVQTRCLPAASSSEPRT